MQQLPAKDQATFRSIVKFYETKQYRKGIKAADQVLKKHPDHGETLCMKGLTLSYLDKKEEAYELVRKGLKFDLKSHVCWHVYGLLYRQDRDYHEAVKCYRQALRIDPDNIQILRDLSLLEIHRRDLGGFTETRRKLLSVKPSNRLNWVGYAVAEHLSQGHEFAWTCLDNYEKTFKEDVAEVNYENSELFMYKATLMEEAGKFEDALNSLTKREGQIVDKLGLQEMTGRLNMFLQRYSEAADIFKRLVRMNPEHHIYILAYMASRTQFHRFWPALPAPSVTSDTAADGEAAKGDAPPATISSFPTSMHPLGMPIWGWLPPQHSSKAAGRVVIGRRQVKRRLETYEPLVPLTTEEEEDVGKFYDELQNEHPRSDSLRRLVLYFVTGARFQQRLDSYLRKQIRKGVPSIFRMLRPIYFQSGKPELVEEVLLSYVRHLEQETAWFGPPVDEKGVTSGTEAIPDTVDEEAPSSLLFALMVAADHFDFVGDTHRALEFINRAIEHTPTFVELYACKSRIYRHAGDFEEAAKLADEARSMDLADRFLNTQCAKAMLRIDDTAGALEKVLLFTKEPDSEATNLHDMQCMWYESAVGRSYYRQGKYGKALKMFHETFRHFNDISEDQFDFHNYCLRKTTLKAYVGMLRMQDRLYSHKFYRRAAKDAIRIYLELYDKKQRGETVGASKADEENKEEGLSAAEKKAAKLKAKKAEAKKAAQEKAAQTTTTTGSKPKKVDEDPDGEKLIEKDPLPEANKLVKNLLTYASSDAATHVLTYDLASRQGRWLHCLQALLSLWELAGRNNTHYKLIAPLAHFAFIAKLDDEATPKAVREVIMAEIAPILGGSSDKPFADVAALRASAGAVVDAVEKRLKENNGLPLIEVLYGLKCLKNAGRDCKAFLESWSPQGAFSLKECKKVLNYLAEVYGKDSTIWERFKKRCLEIFPLMVIA